MSHKLQFNINDEGNNNFKKNKLTSSFLINDILSSNSTDNKNHETQLNLPQDSTLFNTASINRQPNLLFSPLKRSIHDTESLNESKDENSENIKDTDDSGKANR